MKLARVYLANEIPSLKVANNGFAPYGSSLLVQSGPLLQTISMITGGLHGEGATHEMPAERRSGEVLALMEKWN